MKKAFIANSLIIIIFILTNNITAQTFNGLFLDGNDNYVEIPDNNSLDLVSSFTIEMWINPDQIDGTRNVIGKFWCQGEASFNLSILEGQIKWMWVSPNGNCNPANVYITDNSVINELECNHIAIVHNANYVKIYHNGILVPGSLTMGNYSDIHTSNEPLRIGVYKLLAGNLNWFYAGSIDEIRFWDYELSQTEIVNRKDTALIGNESGLVAYYKMSDTGMGDGVTVTNSASSTGSALNGITHGTSTTPYFDQFCVVDTIPQTINEDIINIEKNVKIYPNPFSDILNFSNYLNNSKKLSVQIINSQGQVMQKLDNITTKEFKLDTDLPKGIYFSIITIDDKEVITNKIVKR